MVVMRTRGRGDGEVRTGVGRLADSGGDGDARGR